jgi:hypothetical protein
MPNTADERWESLPLEMTRRGIQEFATLTEKAPRGPAVYAHVEVSTRRVLRVGQTGDSIHGRWTTSPKGHLSTIEWAMGWSDRYKAHAPNFPQYVLFFYRLAGVSTRVWYLICEESFVKETEDKVRDEYGPVWETFNRLCGVQGVRKGQPRGEAVSRCDFTDPNLPKLDGIQSQRLWSISNKGT